ncbi:hypothetical protein ACS0TY_010391 [Phlomoides rotata]
MASSDLMRDLFGEDSDNEVNSQDNGAQFVEDSGNEENCQDNGAQNNLSSVPTENNQEHARVRGFSAVKRTLAKRNEQEPKYALIVCDKASTSKANKSSKKIDCKAHLNAKKLHDESWIVTKMVTGHNHEIVPSFSLLMPAHMHLNVHIRTQLEANDIAGIRNFIEERRRLRLGDGDAEAICKMFATLQLKDRNFYHLMDIDEESILHNILWIHPRSKAAYGDFYDIGIWFMKSDNN